MESSDKRRKAESHQIYAEVPAGQTLFILGMGAIGRGVLPLVLRHIKVDRQQITVASARDDEAEEARKHNVRFEKMELSRDNYAQLLSPHLKSGDVFLNLSSCVSSIDLVKLCQERDVVYIDSSNETWDDSPDELHLTHGRYISKEAHLPKRRGTPSALMSHGANPGMVNHFVKHALVTMARDEWGPDYPVPSTRDEWAQLAMKLEVEVIQISERDTQVSNIRRKPGEFACTWCCSAMRDESSEPSQVPLGTHEDQQRPIKNRSDSYVRLHDSAPPTWYSGNFAGNNFVKSWNPVHGAFLGSLTPHDETFSMSRYLEVPDRYRPTSFFCYSPAEDAIISLRDWFARFPADPDSSRLLLHDIVDGADVLGVLICRKGRKKSLWYGSLLDIHTARTRLDNASATTLTVCASVLAGLVYVMKNRKEGFMEPDDVDYRQVLPIMLPYLEPMRQEYTDWTPSAAVENGDSLWLLKHFLLDAK